MSETFEHGGWRVTAEPNTRGRLQLWQRDFDGEWIDVGWNTPPAGLRDLIAAAAAALGDGALVVDRARLRAALEYACAWGMQQNRSQPWTQFMTAAQSYADATIAELTAPEVER